MPDTYVETKTTGYGSRILNSIKGIFFGFILFLASFGVLYWNEGRINLYKEYKRSIEINSESPTNNSDIKNKLVSTTGILTATELLDDDSYLKQENYIALERKVEVYAWVEKSESKSTSNTGGSETTETTYSYKQDWVDVGNIPNSSEFKQPTGHENSKPALLTKSERYTVNQAKVGTYSINIADITLPEMFPLELTGENVILKDNIIIGDSQHLYFGNSNINQPVNGDTRISYKSLDSGINATVFGKVEGDRIVPYTGKKDTKIFRLFTVSREEALQQVNTEEKLLKWGLRILGFIMMWFGLMLILGPIATVLDFFPLLGKISGSILSISAFIIALVLSALTIIISMILHSTIALIIIGLIVLTVLGLLIRARSRTQDR